MKRKLFIFDIHGTLLTSKYNILDSTKQALQKLANEGHIIAIASGHHYSKIESIVKELGIKVIAIGNTGALIKNFDNGQIFQLGSLDHSFVLNVINEFKKYPSVLYIHNKKEHRVVRNKLTISEAMSMPVNIEKKDFCTLDYAIGMTKIPITQISIKTNSNNIPKIYKQITKLNNFTPPHRQDNVMNIFVDCGPTNTSKWTGTLKIAKMFNINIDDIYCFGDDINDYDMLRNCKNSVAMGNSLVKIKKISRYVTNSNDNNGIKAFLDKYIWKNNFILPKGLYGITSNIFSKYPSHIKSAQALLTSGIKIIQYRNKNSDFKMKINDCLIIKKMCKANNALFIINDDIELAKQIDADGVHVGIDDLKLNNGYYEIQKKIGANKIFGFSVRNKNEYNCALKNDWDYIGVGSINFTKTKNDIEIIDKKLVEIIASEKKIPIVAIGGININNIQELLDLNISTFCVISDLFLSKNLKSKINKYNKLIK